VIRGGQARGRPRSLSATLLAQLRTSPQKIVADHQSTAPRCEWKPTPPRTERSSRCPSTTADACPQRAGAVRCARPDLAHQDHMGAPVDEDRLGELEGFLTVDAWLRFEVEAVERLQPRDVCVPDPATYGPLPSVAHLVMGQLGQSPGPAEIAAVTPGLRDRGCTSLGGATLTPTSCSALASRGSSRQEGGRFGGVEAAHPGTGVFCPAPAWKVHSRLRWGPGGIRSPRGRRGAPPLASTIRPSAERSCAT
jgi:hypothetical protein